MKTEVKICRFNPPDIPAKRFDSHIIPYSRGMTVLDAIQYIQTNIDSTIAYRYECKMGVCGTCAVMLNDIPVLSCQTQLPNDRENIIAPLANFPVERDLIVNLVPVLEKFQKIRPYLERVNKAIISKSQADASKPFRKCIECGCCIAASFVVSKRPEIKLDPMGLVKLARYVTDPRDGLDRIKIARESGIEYYSVQEGEELTKICPRNIPIDKAIQILKNEN